MTIVALPTKRHVYELTMGGGYSNPHHHFRWVCPLGCGFSIDQCEDDPNPETARIIAQDAADRHQCPPVDFPVPARVAQDGSEHRLVKPEVPVSTTGAGSLIPTLTVIRRKHSNAGNVGTCSGCGAPVIWLVSSHDKLTPIDPAPVPTGNCWIDLETGTWGHLASRPDTPADQRYVVHFVTCPKAGEFRRA